MGHAVDSWNVCDYSYARLSVGLCIDNILIERRKKIVQLLQDQSIVQSVLTYRYRELLLWLNEAICSSSYHDVTAAIDTCCFLQGCVQTMIKQGALSSSQSDVLVKLQKKIEVFKRVFDGYDENVRKVGDNYRSLLPYALLAVVCGAQYMMTDDLRFLNTTIKTNDIIAGNVWSVAGEDVFVAGAMRMEEIGIRHAYD